MTAIDAAGYPPSPSRGGAAWLRPTLALGLIVAADVLLFDQPHGIGWFLMAFLLAAGIVATHPLSVKERGFAKKAALPFLALLPLIENVSSLSLIIAAIALAAFALSCSGRRRGGISRMAGQLVVFFVAAPFRWTADITARLALHKRMGGERIAVAGLLTWVMPAVIGGAFIALFSLANPVVEYWLSLIDIPAWLARMDIARVGFWIASACAAWALLRPRLPRWLHRTCVLRAAVHRTPAPLPASLSQALFGRAALLRALLLFNAIFAVQTVMDAIYLWGGVALPDGVTYASYAHRGAYALIATALLAALFVLLAMRPAGAASEDRLIRNLVYVWTAQNVWLVLSSILRLDLYVSIYSLTYWRIAAFLWMGLVATGLILIIARIALRKSNEWLLSANLLTLSSLLYACCFINFAAFIASYNVDHAAEITGNSLEIDVSYLRQLGPPAFPAIDRLLAATPQNRLCAYDMERGEDFCLSATRAGDELAFREAAANWRSWSVRNWRMLRYLDTQALVSTQHGVAPPTERDNAASYSGRR